MLVHFELGQHIIHSIHGRAYFRFGAGGLFCCRYAQGWNAKAHCLSGDLLGRLPTRLKIWPGNYGSQTADFAQARALKGLLGKFTVMIVTGI